MFARVGLPPPHDGVDVERIELQPEAAPTGALGRDHAGAAAKKAVEHDVAACGAVQDSVSDQSAPALPLDATRAGCPPR